MTILYTFVIPLLILSRTPFISYNGDFIYSLIFDDSIIWTNNLTGFYSRKNYTLFFNNANGDNYNCTIFVRRDIHYADLIISIYTWILVFISESLKKLSSVSRQIGLILSTQELLSRCYSYHFCIP